LIAPSATHRLRFHRRDRTFIIESANKYLIAALVALAVAMTLAIAVVTDFLWDGWVVWAFPGLLLALIVAIWFVRPLARG
jgi:Flp pilus assembly protein TadB